MDYFFSKILEITPHWMEDVVFEHYIVPIKEHIKTPAMQIVIVLLSILLLLSLAIGIVIGLIFLASFILIDVLKLT